ncbi:ATP-binding protein [Streptomyces sp. NPDC032472]|uniref:ATP-binding protein n=1 Tax=Streptomyces sp. NPDC032472 TaxID=3155018 RepID=UPI0033DA8875
MGPGAAGGPTCEQARDVTSAVLAAHGVTGPDAEDALLVVTELVANARRHAGGATAFRIRCRPPEALVQVSDAEPDPPLDGPTPADVPGRFGWLIINRLAEHVTVESRPSGKTITVVVAAHSAQEGAPRFAAHHGDRDRRNDDRTHRRTNDRTHRRTNGGTHGASRAGTHGASRAGTHDRADDWAQGCDR